MLDRNRRIKSKPERFQNTDEQFDVIFTVEERIYDSVVEGSRVCVIWQCMVFTQCLVYTAIEAKGNVTCTPVQIINLEIKDNHEDATLGAFLILQLCELVSL